MSSYTLNQPNKVITWVNHSFNNLNEVERKKECKCKVKISKSKKNKSE
jgi:hypothetical protein